MKKKLFSLFIMVWINLVFIKNEVIPHDDFINTTSNNLNNSIVNETNSNYTHSEELEIKNNISTNSTNSTEVNSVNTTEINKNKEEEKLPNDNTNTDASQATVEIENNKTEIINNETIANNNVTLENNTLNSSNQTSSNIDSNDNSTQVSADTVNEKTQIKEEENKAQTNIDSTNEKRKLSENKTEESTQQINENAEKQKENKEFNLTEEIEKLYYSRQNETSSQQEDSYLDGHNSDFYENIEEVRAKEEEEYKLRMEREEEERLRDEWQTKVSDFTAQDLLTIKLKKYSSYKFYEDVQKIPSRIRVAFFVNDEYKKLNFEIFEPKGSLIFTEKNKAQSYFEFEAKKRGVYKFVLTNHDSVSSLKASFALHAGENIDSNLKSSHLDEFTKHLKHVDRKLKELKFTHSILNKKYDGHHESTLVHNYRIRFYSILETSLMCIILVVQLFYIKNLIKDY